MKLGIYVFGVSYEYDTSMTHDASTFHHAAMHDALVWMSYNETPDYIPVGYGIDAET